MPANDNIFDRVHEQQELLGRFEQRRPLLLHGESGAGKSLLLGLLCREVPETLYCAASGGLQQICRQVALKSLERSRASLRRKLGGEASKRLKSMSSSSLRGIVADILTEERLILVLDHFGFASRQVASLLKSWIASGTPVVVVTRSAHMEEVGYAASLFVERRDRFLLANFDPGTALNFAEWMVEKRRLQAVNLPDFKRRIVEMSRGNPGMIAKLVELAARPEYRSGDHIKVTPLYLDLKLHGAGAPS
jgi:hypothetical protein